ncbi:B-cell lymphoma 3 protein isoform X1 [Crotalus tigris]|uniref:B-cell lymphoma 3 protein isoform X1 n=1 Tax=Crotalus tigris TaxID=88082 RepID=UPI00192F95F9|nr:B-cell lymphoma 3 protein isoform X1 [Crotalus tigris]
MAGEFPVDLRTWRKQGRQDKHPPSHGDPPLTPSGQLLPGCLSSGALPEPGARDTSMGQADPQPRTRDAASPKAGLQEEKKQEMYLPLRKRRYAVEGANGDTPGPLAGKVPKMESGQEGSGSRQPHSNGYHPCYVSMPYPRVPVSYYPGLASPFLNPELTPLLQPSLLGILPSYSFMPPPEAQLALDIATATQQDEDGDTPLHIAVAQGNLLAAQHLVILFQHGQRDLDIFNNLRQTPLHLAVIIAQPSLVKLLLSHGASPMVLDRNGQTALHLACEHGSLRCLRELLEGSPAGLDLEARNFEGFTPLHLAVGSSNSDMVLALLDHGADVDAVDIKSGRSPLLHVVENNNLDMVELLLQHGANVNAQSYGGNTALHTASGRGLLDMLRLLVRNGADGGLKNYHNDTALMVARNKRAIDILRGKASRPIPHPESSHDGSSPTISAASSPGVRTHPHVLHASPDSCSTIPSPDQTPKPHRAGHSPNTTALRPESIIVTNEPLTSAPLPGVELERRSHSSTLEQPMGFPRSSKGLLRENMTDPAFHTVPLYPFSPSSPHLSSHPLQLLPMGLNHPVISMPPGPLANRMSMRYPGMDQSQRLLDSEGPAVLGCEGQWLHSSDNGPGGS